MGLLYPSFPRKRESTCSCSGLALEGRWTPDQVRDDELSSSLLLGEVHIDDVGSVIRRLRLGCVILCRLMRFRGLLGRVRLEGQGELDRRVVELGHRGERHVQ